MDAEPGRADERAISRGIHQESLRRPLGCGKDRIAGDEGRSGVAWRGGRHGSVSLGPAKFAALGRFAPPNRSLQAGLSRWVTVVSWLHT